MSFKPTVVSRTIKLSCVYFKSHDGGSQYDNTAALFYGIVSMCDDIASWLNDTVSSCIVTIL